MEGSDGMLTDYIYLLKGVHTGDIKPIEVRKFLQDRMTRYNGTKEQKLRELDFLRDAGHQMGKIWLSEVVQVINEVSKVPSTEGKTYSITELSKIIGTSTRTIHYWITKGELKIVGTPEKYLLREQDIEECFQLSDKSKYLRIWNHQKGR